MIEHSIQSIRRTWSSASNNAGSSDRCFCFFKSRNWLQEATEKIRHANLCSAPTRLLLGKETSVSIIQSSYQYLDPPQESINFRSTSSVFGIPKGHKFHTLWILEDLRDSYLKQMSVLSCCHTKASHWLIHGTAS